MGVNDWGDPGDLLNAPALGGTGGWADSVAAALDRSDITVANRIAQSMGEHVADPDPHPQYAGSNSVQVFSPSGTGEDVCAQVWDAANGRWQTAHYDSGTRGIGPFLNGWTGTFHVRRINSTVYFRVPYGAPLEGAAATSATFMNPSQAIGPGFAPSQMVSVEDATLWLRISGAIIASGYFYWAGQWDTPAFGAADTRYASVNGASSWITNDAIPTALPGTLIAPAPAI